MKNVSEKSEGELLAELLYRGRIEARDFFLNALRVEREALRVETDMTRVLRVCVENAMTAEGPVGRAFWLDAIVETLLAQPDADRERLYLHAARLIEATYAITPRERHDAVRYVADRLVPIT